MSKDTIVQEPNCAFSSSGSSESFQSGCCDSERKRPLSSNPHFVVRRGCEPVVGDDILLPHVNHALVAHPLYSIPYKMVHRYFFDWDKSLIREDELSFGDTSLRFLALQACKVCHHLMEVEVALIVPVNELVNDRVS